MIKKGSNGKMPNNKPQQQSLKKKAFHNTQTTNTRGHIFSKVPLITRNNFIGLILCSSL